MRLVVLSCFSPFGAALIGQLRFSGRSVRYPEEVKQREAGLELRETFEALFVAPIASHRWSSDRGRTHWGALDWLRDSLAGPLWSIVNKGGCGYVYQRDDFAGVTDPETLRLWLLEGHARLAAAVAELIPASPAESLDLVFMQSVAGQVRELIERAIAVEKARWEAGGERGTGRSGATLENRG